MTEFSGYCIEDLSLGMEATFAKVISDADITSFSVVSGDTNPVHLDDAYAAKTRFGGRIAHGMLSASLISAVIGTRLPGPGAIYMSQSLRFRAPVKPGDTVTARVVVSAMDERRRRVTLTCEAHVGDTLVIDGEALVMVPSKADAA
ncbi:MAG: MaoC family dehydratase [Parvibaculaceae bacterium]